jgi:oligopeptide/dipeptide ABC transporter ATP-binding protein
VIEHTSDRIAVMYLGKLVEVASDQALIGRPAHPYTQALLSAVPQARPGAKKQRKRLLKGDVPSPINPPPGCRFHPRCPLAEKRCRDKEPQLKEIEPDHWAACFQPGGA